MKASFLGFDCEVLDIRPGKDGKLVAVIKYTDSPRSSEQIVPFKLLDHVYGKLPGEDDYANQQQDQYELSHGA